MTPSARRAPALAGLLCAALASLPSAAGVTARGPEHAAASSPTAGPPARPAHWLHVRVWEPGSAAPNVSLRVPTALVSVTVGLLSWTGVFDHAAEVARARAGDRPGCPRLILSGRDLVNLWSILLKGGTAQLVQVHAGDGSAVEIGLE